MNRRRQPVTWRPFALRILCGLALFAACKPMPNGEFDPNVATCSTSTECGNGEICVGQVCVAGGGEVFFSPIQLSSWTCGTFNGLVKVGNVASATSSSCSQDAGLTMNASGGVYTLDSFVDDTAPFQFRVVCAGELQGPSNPFFITSCSARTEQVLHYDNSGGGATTLGIGARGGGFFPTVQASCDGQPPVALPLLNNEDPVSFPIQANSTGSCNAFVELPASFGAIGDAEIVVYVKVPPDGCQSDDQCASGSVCGPSGTCQDGIEGDPCSDAYDCVDPFFCSTAGICQDGSAGDACGYDGECASGSCTANLTCAP